MPCSPPTWQPQVKCYKDKNCERTNQMEWLSIWLLPCLVSIIAILFSLWVLSPKNNTDSSSSSDVISNAPEAGNITTNLQQIGGWDYEVFLSFRGPDTRATFTDFLYVDLISAGVRAFRDDEELRVGEQIGADLLEGIRSSRISIPIFSKGYATSKWCLLELAQMVECRSSMGQLIWPIFYDVTPMDVKQQKGSFEESFEDHSKRFDDETLQKWREALAEVGSLKGWEVVKFPGGHQGSLIKTIVREVWKELQKSSMAVTENLIGIDYHIEEIMPLLDVNSSDIRGVGIHGMGGIGKTTIAKVIYNQLSKCFEHCCFLADVREVSQSKGLVELQKKLIYDILKHKPNVSMVDDGTKIIRERFGNKKVLVVLDDVDQREQFDALAQKRDWFGPGSRIIVTTRNKYALKEPEIDWIYEVKEMDSLQSLQLFSKHAFRRDHPPEDYKELSESIVFTAAGLPLALEVIGSFLSGKGKHVWEGALKKLKETPHKDVQNKLKISFDALGRVEKQIFLDIACLFAGKDKRIAFYMWEDCKYYPEIGLETLQLMSLVKVEDDNELRMHDQLRDLGREIVREEDDPGKYSRLWSHEEALEVLETGIGTRKVEALCLNFRVVSEDHCLRSEQFSNLSNLRFLQVNYATLTGDFKNCLLRLRWICWSGCPQNFGPTSFTLKYLVILDFSWSQVTEDCECWGHIKIAKKLKVLNLSGCVCLRRTPNLSSYETLERLLFEDCENLVQIDPSIENLNSLVSLNLKNCSKLRKLPQFGSMEALVEVFIDGTSIQEIPFTRAMKRLETLSATCCGSLSQISSSISHLMSLSDLALDFSGITEIPESIGSLVKLRHLSLKYCSSLRSLPETIGQLESLMELHLFNSTMTELPDGIVNLKNLRVLDLDYSRIKRLTDSIGKLKKLEEINASHCYDLEGDIPNSIESLTCLRILTLDCTKICKLPSCIYGLSRLQKLYLVGCSELQSLPDLPSSIIHLRITCESMEVCPFFSNMSNLRELWFSKCTKLVEISGDIGKLSQLETMIFFKVNISTLPVDVGNLTRLRRLTIQDCNELKSLTALPSSLFSLCLQVCESMENLPDLSNLQNLSELSLGQCSEIIEIQGLGELERLTALDVSECEKLPRLDGLDRLQSLRYLNTSRCKSLTRLPDLSNSKKLRKLVTLGCNLLVEIQGLDKLEFLEHLNMAWCTSVERLPNLSSLIMLKDLIFDGCNKLQDLEGLEDLKSLKRLDMSQCTSLQRLPNLSSVRNLKELRLCGCEKLSEIWGLEELESLAFLDISGCKSIKKLPDLAKIKKVKE